jgi:hypothetical protein
MAEPTREPTAEHEDDEDVLEAISDGASLLEQLSRETIDLSMMPRAESHASSQHSSKSIIISNTVVTPEQSDAEEEDEDDDNDRSSTSGADTSASTSVELVYGDQRNRFAVS